MATKKLKRAATAPLIIEDHPKDYDGYPFITLIKYRDKHTLNIVDNSDHKKIQTFVLDLCGPESVEEESIILIAAQWYENNAERYPLSFEFSRIGVSEHMSKILRTYNIGFVTRVIGPLPVFPMNEVKSTKRRRRKVVPSGVMINSKVIRLHE